MTALIKVEIDKLLAAGIIRPSLSTWASPVVAVLKPDGTARITVNYKKLNAQTIVPQIPIPNIEDLLNSLGGASVFSTMDITSGYFTSSISPDAIPLTAMVTSFGLYEWLRCPQGAAGAPGHFTRLMQTALAGLSRVQPYIDDVIVSSTSIDEHLGDLKDVFARFEKHGMKLAPAKLHVGCKHVKFLGHIVGVDGIRPDPAKVQALLEMPEPGNLSQLRAWLGLANYYRRFVRGMAVLVAPLTALMAKGAEFNISAAQRRAMRDVNEALALHTVMRYPDYAAAASGERPFILATDACKEGFGAVLAQADANGLEQPIAFTSRATLPNERNWSTTDLEAGAIVNGIKKFRHMLWGTPFTLLTDHRALQYMESIRERTARGGRWAEFLSAFDINVVYKKGSAHGNADGPSRNPLPATAEDAAEAERERLLHAYGLEVVDAHRLEALAIGEYLELCMLISDALQGGGVGELAAMEEAAGAAPAACSAFAENEELGRLTPGDWQREQRADKQIGALFAFLADGVLPSEAAIDTQVKQWAQHCTLRACGDSQLLVRTLGLANPYSVHTPYIRIYGVHTAYFVFWSLRSVFFRIFMKTAYSSLSMAEAGKAGPQRAHAANTMHRTVGGRRDTIEVRHFEPR